MGKKLLDTILDIGIRAKIASRIIASSSYETRQNALKAMADKLLKYKDSLLSANRKDIEDAEKKGLSEPLIKRL